MINIFKVKESWFLRYSKSEMFYREYYTTDLKSCFLNTGLPVQCTSTGKNILVCISDLTATFSALCPLFSKTKIYLNYGRFCRLYIDFMWIASFLNLLKRSLNIWNRHKHTYYIILPVVKGSYWLCVYRRVYLLTSSIGYFVVVYFSNSKLVS